MVCWCDWFSYQLHLHLPQQKEAPKGRRVTRKNEPLSNGPSGRQGWGVGGKPLDTNQGRKGNSRAGVPPTVEKDGVQKYNWWGKALAETNQSKGGAEAETQMWCEEPVWSEETLKSDIMEIPLSYTRITKMTCQNKPRQNVWIFKVKMETQSYQHSLGRESTGHLEIEERKKRKGCPQPCPFQESNGKQWQFYLSWKEKAVVAQQCPVELPWSFMSQSCTDIPRQARAASEHLWVHASSSQGKMDSRERSIYQLPAAQGWWPQTRYFSSDCLHWFIFPEEIIIKSASE